MISDSGKISHPKQIISLYALTATAYFLPRGNKRRNQDIAKLCPDYMQSQFHTEVEIDEKLAKSFVSQYNKGQLAPLAAIIGSLTASEAMKALTRKFTPIKQWFAFDAIECIHPEMNNEDSLINIEPADSLEKQILGHTTGEYLESAKIFMVGAGAIGCELLKLFALMNVATKASGFLRVTDMNRIEKSNLNRYFLFRPQDIGCFKSEVACRAAKQINPMLNILPMTVRMNSQADAKYNVQFYRDLDLIVNALDDIGTSKWYKKSLYTLGSHNLMQLLYIGVAKNFEFSAIN
ncbi:MAG: E1 ubiquitin-activating protein [Marteilia pararefringens]